ncbi:type IV pilus assembly protein PilM [Saccharospirillum sp. HFRX-1]|uniref:type IV pilus biogenesis protein PilM n=1 Tax=unclassified Saccharospirillum TaxID=2633430 RepID=UPI003714AB18
MTTLFRKKPAPVLGIDISSSAIRLVELSVSGHSHRVEAYACEPLAEGIVVERAIRNPEQLGQSIARLVQRSRSRIRQAAVAVSGSSVITKVIEVDDLPTDLELEQLIQLEAPPHIPYPLEDVALDFDVLGPAPGQPGRLQVLLAASRREEVDALDDVLQSAGLDAQLVDVETLVLERSLALVRHQYDTSPAKAVALLDISHSRLTLSVFKGQQTLYRREQSLNRREQPLTSVTEAVPFFSDSEQAAGDQSDQPEPQLQHLSEAVQQTLQFFYATSQSGPLDAVLLAGDHPALAALAEPLAQATALPTVLADPISQLECAAAVNRHQLKDDSSALLVACGLALRSFDHGHR